MDLPEDDRWFWRQNVAFATEIGRAIHEHVRTATPTTRALEPFKNRITGTLDSLTALDRFAKNDWRADGMTLIRAMYDAQLQVLYILAEPAEAPDRAQLFLDFRWIEQRRRQELLQGNPTQFAQTLLRSPKRAEGEAAREENYQRLRPKYLTRKGKPRPNWYPGTLWDLAEAVGLEFEYNILQRTLSGAVHSTPTALLAGLTFSSAEHLLLIGWRILFRVLGRIAQHHGAPLAQEHEEIVREAMRNLFDLPDGDVADQ